MKKILLVTRPICPPWDEGSKNFAYYLAKNTSGFEFYLLTNGILPDLPKNVHQEPIYTSGSFGFFQKMRLIKHLRKIRNDFDTIHYLFTPTKQNSFLIKKLVKSNKAKIIQTIATLREDLFSEKEIRNILFGDLIITYSQYAKNKLNTMGYANVRQIYPGIDLNRCSPASKDDQFMKSFGISSDDFVIFYPGEYARLGATDDIVKMALENADTIKRNKMKLIFPSRVKTKEDKSKKEEIENILKKNNLASQVLFPDTFTSMGKAYNLSDLIIFPVQDMKGKFDVPLAIIEAMACGKPVIVSDIPILKEFMNDHNSVIIETGNTEKLFSEILELYNNPAKRKAIGNAARIYAQENFDIKKISEKYKETYAQL